MGGHDPYSASKGSIELLVASYRRSFFPPAQVSEHGIKVATVRAGNVIGGGDWASDRIVPDIVAHLNANLAVPLRYPGAVRPWQHVLAPLHGYLLLASRMLSSDDASLCSGWNFGPNAAGTSCVSELVEQFCTAWGSGTWKDVGNIHQPHEDRCCGFQLGRRPRSVGIPCGRSSRRLSTRLDGSSRLMTAVGYPCSMYVCRISQTIRATWPPQIRPSSRKPEPIGCLRQLRTNDIKRTN